MRLIAWRILGEFCANGHTELEPTLRIWYKTAELADWKSFADVRRSFPATDLVGDRLIFNIRGNRYRLVCAVNFEARVVLVKWIGTHAEYDRIDPETIQND